MNLASREPLVIRAAITAAITAALHVLVVLGVFPIDPDVETAIAGAVDLAGTAVLVIWTRGKVTPVAAPQLPTTADQPADYSATDPVNFPDENGPRHLAE